MDDNKKENGWKIDKNIPIVFILSVVILVIVQGVSAVWTFATVTSELKNLTHEVQDIKSDVYRISDAEKDKELINHKFDILGKRVDNLERK